MVSLTELTELRNPADYVYKNQKQNWATQLYLNTFVERFERTTKKLTVSILT